MVLTANGGPWVAQVVDEDYMYEVGILAYASVFVFIQLYLQSLSRSSSLFAWWRNRPRAPTPGSTKARRNDVLLASTLVGFFHAGYSSMTGYMVILNLNNETRGVPLNEEAHAMYRQLLMVSMGFIVSDVILYARICNDIPVAIHHLVMIICNMPTGSKVALKLLSPPGLENELFWGVAAMYLCEASNIFLNFRWLLLQTLTDHSALYTLNNSILLVVYIVSRVFWFPYIMYEGIWVHYDLFASAEKLPVAYLILSAIGFMFVLSTAWTGMMVKNGISAFIFYKKKDSKGKKDS
eukprot:m.21351 g.21351  ORF g.21351 m.21351 type:complete len:294 (+) comp7121_c0_seq1:143-1024(+)